MPHENGNSVDNSAPLSESTRAASELEQVETKEEAEFTEEPESYTLAKPRREGIRAEIKFLETQSDRVSLRSRPKVDVAISQGDIFRNITFIEDVFENKEGLLQLPRIIFPQIIVLTQACDLEHAKYLFSVLVAPLYNSEHVFRGKHLSELSFSTEEIKKDSTRGKNIIQNKDPRYHYIQFPEGVQLPNLIIDFQQYFSMNIEYLKGIRNVHLVWTIPPLWREHISQRFAAFLARIGLPQPVPPPDTSSINEALRWPKKG